MNMKQLVAIVVQKGADVILSFYAQVNGKK